MSWTGRVVDVHDVHTFKWTLTNCHSFLPLVIESMNETTARKPLSTDPSWFP